jgi:hypothetical protein
MFFSLSRQTWSLYPHVSCKDFLFLFDWAKEKKPSGFPVSQPYLAFGYYWNHQPLIFLSEVCKEFGAIFFSYSVCGVSLYYLYQIQPDCSKVPIIVHECLCHLCCYNWHWISLSCMSIYEKSLTEKKITWPILSRSKFSQQEIGNPGTVFLFLAYWSQSQAYP